ncbi:cyclase family protein [Actinoplanes derwentensis]|uniref:Kynurenine formamidase n=1 Tax=Actinoplanes derwentensis TaxID=113562 RepID=A0A1H1UCB2_9ACTN|nr:cyclase family protein [Actinoplanes derwentensis]GID85259.1 cyclase [Actinoplanes derwentensis]SDS69846.1 Kynurenine formamidase [Actinoplanes derwentensis]
MTDSLDNWGRWGDRDQLGAVNLITDEARTRGAAEARTGQTVSLARITTPFPLTGGPLAPATAPTTAVQTMMLFTGFGAPAMAEVMVVTTHHPEVTHLDGLGHWAEGGRVYPGVGVADSSGPTGVRHGAADVFGGGILTRGVLLDLAPGGRLAPAHPVTAAELDAAAGRAGVDVLSGDALLVRGGWDRATAGDVPLPGVTADAVHWLHEKGIAVYAGDVGDAMPPLPGEMPGALHRLALGRLAIPLIDGPNLEELAVTCERLGRWTFQFVVAAPRIAGTTGLPVNPLAVF